MDCMMLMPFTTWFQLYRGGQCSYPCFPGVLLTLYHTIPTFNDPKEEAFGKHCGKRRKCWQPAFSSFPTVFSNLLQREIVILAILHLSSANAFNLVMSKKLSFGKELISMLSNIISKSLAAFLHALCRNNGQGCERNESCCNACGRARDQTSHPLFSSPVCYWLRYRQSQGSNQPPPVLKSCMLLTEVQAEPGIKPATPCSQVLYATDWGTGRARDQTSHPLFSSPVCYWLRYRQSQGSNQPPPVLKSCMLLTEVQAEPGIKPATPCSQVLYATDWGTGRARDQTSHPLFSSPVCYWLRYRQSQGSNQPPPVLKSCMLLTEVQAEPGIKPATPCSQVLYATDWGTGRARDQTSHPLFSSPVCYWLRYPGLRIFKVKIHHYRQKSCTYFPGTRLFLICSLRGQFIIMWPKLDEARTKVIPRVSVFGYKGRQRFLVLVFRC